MEKGCPTHTTPKKHSSNTRRILKKTPQLIEEAARSFPDQTKSIMLWSEDEARFGRMNNPRRSWAPPKTRPIVRLQRVREYMYVFAATSPWSGETFSLIFPLCNTDAMKFFLKEFSKQYSAYNNIMIVDQAGWHVTKKLGIFDNITFIPLPPGSPELNPTEHLWEHIREKYLGNHVYNSLDAVEEKMITALQEISHDQETIKKLTGFHWLCIS